MHHQIVDHWSRQSSALHALDSRAKIITLVIFLIVLATTPLNAHLALALDVSVLLLGIWAARLPVLALLLRASSILPFSVLFAAVTWVAGDHIRALSLVIKSYLSTLAVLLVTSTTPLPQLVDGLLLLGAPALLITIAQFIYRYLFVISEQAQRMKLAATSRGGLNKRHASIPAAIGSVVILFARSYERAGGIHRAMLSRCYRHDKRIVVPIPFHMPDALFTAGISLGLILVRFS